MFKLFKLSSNQRGISLIEVMVAAGISGVIAMATMKIAENSQTAMRKVSADSDLNNFYNIRLQGGLGSDEGCMDAMGALTLDAGQTRTYATGESLTTNGFVLATVGQEIPNSTDWTLTSMLFERDATNTSLCRLVVSLDRTERRSIGARSINKILEIGCHWDDTTTPDTLVSCAANSTSTTEGYWTKENNGSTTWLEYDAGGASSIFLGDYAGGTFPPARLSIKDMGTPYVWNTPVNEGIAMSPNHAIRWGNVEIDNAGIGIYADTANDLHVREGTTDYVTIQDGNMGIGTTAPGEKLQVAGNLQVNSGFFGVGGHGSTYMHLSHPNYKGSGQYALLQHGTAGHTYLNSVGTGDIFFRNDNVTQMMIRDDGNVGIGTSAPASKLDIVNGSLRLPASGYEGAGQIQSTGTIRFATGGAAQAVYAKQISASNSWADNDTYSQLDGIYSKGNLRVGGATNALFANTTNGRVGIGTVSPDSKLTVVGSQDPAVLLLSGGAGLHTAYGIGRTGREGNLGIAAGVNYSSIASGGDLVLRNITQDIIINANNGAGSIRFSTGNPDVERMAISNSGNVGIGISPGGTYKLEVGGSIAASAFYYSSDERFKKDIQTIESPLEKVSLLRGVKFQWIESGEEDIGFIAQEVEEVEPALVSTDDSEKKLKAVKYGNITSLLVEAVKELKEMVLAAFTDIDELKEENELLKARLDEQETRLDAQERLLRELASEKE